MKRKMKPLILPKKLRRNLFSNEVVRARYLDRIIKIDIKLETTVLRHQPK